MKAITDFDFAKICESNIFVKKMLDLFNLKQSDIFLFIKIIESENYCELQNVSKEQIELLVEQRELILYTKNLENEIISQYFNMIHYVAKQLGIKANSDDYLSYGLEGLRKSVFYYRDASTSFKTYSFNGIKQGLQHWQYHHKPVKNQIIRPLLATDVFKNDDNEYKFENAAVYKFDSEEDDVIEIIRALADDKERFIDLINVLSDHANISELDKKIILGMTFDNVGRNGWVEKFISAQALTCTKATIYNRYNQGVSRLHKAFVELGLEF
jgi:hypothetical protein